MSTPAGRLFGTETGVDLVLLRSFRAPIEDVWASLTESERTARWFGPWEGEAGPGSTIRVRMVFEEGEPWMDMAIGACEPPRRLEISSVDDYGSWLLEVVLTETRDAGAAPTTELRFTQHLDSEKERDAIPEVGPGWEYYLDQFVAARESTERLDFDDYYPAMRDYYAALRPE